MTDAHDPNSLPEFRPQRGSSRGSLAVMNTLPPLPVMRRAFAEKDSAFDGTFFVAVKSTSIFCRPVCRAKPPKPENVEFFATANEALRNGYRACKLCHPLNPAAGRSSVVSQLIRLVEEDPSRRLGESDLTALGVDPSTARRQFRSHCGMTFAAYQRARRMGAALREVRQGGSVIFAQVGAGFESSSGFRRAFAHLFGTAASRSDDVALLTADWVPTPLGSMLVIASDEGIVLCDFVDRKGLATALGRLRVRFGSKDQPAAIVPGEHAHLTAIRAQLSEYFAGTRQSFTVPLSPRGTAFEGKAWEHLRTIPYGQTRSYGEQASAMRSPQAVRAVGRANGMNYLSILIPCHRVIGAGGELTGYGGGLARKRWLLNHERSAARVGG
jgi:AraC family transcriptional regulator of adaptative response/methylated-DNA-[protein]-cysteine methyltransferase